MPSSESELQCKSEIETCEENQEAEPASNMEVQRDRFGDSSVLPQEPRVDISLYTSLETKLVNEKLNSSSNYGPCVPSPCQQDDFIFDNNPPEHASPSLGVGSDGHKPSTLHGLAEICPRPLISQEVSVNHGRDSSQGLRSPKQHQEDHVNDLPSCAQLMERERTPLVDAASCSSFRSLSMNVSDAVNPRKRSRSFTVRPKASKMRRTNLWSDPTNQNSGVDIRFDHIQQNVINRCRDHSDVPELETTVQDSSPNFPLANVAAPEDRLSFRNDQQVCELYLNNETHDVSSEPNPPQLYPFFLDDVYQNQPPFPDPPKLAPIVPFPSTNKSSSASVPSQTFSSICIESALVPDTFSPASSESDWDSGLLSRLAPPVHLQPKEGSCELDLGLLLQSSCAGMQDGSYTSRLCSVLQPTASSSHAGFGEPNTVYRPIETMDRRIIQSLGV